MLVLIRERRERIKSILKKIAKNSHMSTKKALNEMFFFVVYMLRHADIETASKIAVFYDLSEEEIALIAGESRAKEIKEFARRKGIKRVEVVEEEEFFKAFEREEKREEVKVEKKEEEEREVEKEKKAKKRRKKKKEKAEVTLDKFFS